LDKVTGAVIESAYKCQIWAEREAERMNYKEMEKDAKNQSNH
jgi:hypothetical protein